MSRPLVVSPAQLRKELSGASMNEFLDALADPVLLRASPRDENAIDASVDETLRGLISQAQAKIENLTHVKISHTRILTAPVDDGLVRGVDYDMEDSPYDWTSAQWRGEGTIKLRWKPLVSLQSVGLRLGGGPLNRVRTFDNSWVSRKAKLGILNVLAFFGRGGAPPNGGVGALPHWQLAMGQWSGSTWNGGHISGLVHVDYTAGLFPRDFDPDTDDPYEACPDFNGEAILKLVRMQAALSVLQSVQDAIGAGGGSISMDGLSENYDPNRFMTRMQGYEARIEKELADVRREWGGGVLMFTK